MSTNNLLTDKFCYDIITIDDAIHTQRGCNAESRCNSVLQPRARWRLEADNVQVRASKEQNFFFEKKKQKTFIYGDDVKRDEDDPGGESSSSARPANAAAMRAAQPSWR